MKFDYQSVQRLGFEGYATNLAINLLEDGKIVDGYKYDSDVYSVSVSRVKDNAIICIRAYVDNMGWQTAEIAL